MVALTAIGCVESGGAGRGRMVGARAPPPADHVDLSPDSPSRAGSGSAFRPSAGRADPAGVPSLLPLMVKTFASSKRYEEEAEICRLIRSTVVPG